MPIAITRIEKEFILRRLFDDQIPVIYLRNGIEYIIKLKNLPTSKIVHLRCDKPIENLKINDKLDFILDFRSRITFFSIIVKEFDGKDIFCEPPESLYRNLDRSFTRTNPPPDLRVKVGLIKNYSSLVNSDASDGENKIMDDIEFFKSLGGNDVNSIVSNLESWVGSHTEEDLFEVKVLNVSASGFFFSIPISSPVLSIILPESLLTANLITPQHKIFVKSEIMRYYEEKDSGFFGCRFLGITAQEIRFLFEFFYGKPFTDDFSDRFLYGKV